MNKQYLVIALSLACVGALGQSVTSAPVQAKRLPPEKGKAKTANSSLLDRYDYGAELQTLQAGAVQPDAPAKAVVGPAQTSSSLLRSAEARQCVSMAQILQPLNQNAGHHTTPVFTFQQYVRDIFLPNCRNKWKESTRSTSEPDIMRYLVPAFGHYRLETIKREQMQMFLEQMAQTLSSNIVGPCAGI